MDKPQMRNMNKRAMSMDMMGWLILILIITVIVLFIIGSIGSAANKDASLIARIFRFG